jgi:3-oxoacyl-[acyl-carrier protein] reductase
MSVDLSNRKALVVGGTHGIGRGVVEYFARAGASVVFAGRDEAAGQDIVSAIRPRRTALLSYRQVDITDGAAAKALIDEAADRLRGLDIIVNAVGIYPSARLADLSREEWERVLSINLTGAFILLAEGLPVLKVSGSGRYVVIGSITGARTGFAGLSHYGASKAGLEGFVRSAAIEAATDGVTVNVVAPGSVSTAALRQLLTDGDLELLTSRIPVGRLGLPEDVAAMVAFLASTDASFITGQSLVIDGGQTLPEVQ